MPDDIDSEIGLLYQRDRDSKAFPLTEIKRALNCFGRRQDLAGLEPAVVHLNPEQAELVEPDEVKKLGLVIESCPRTPRNYIWLTGRRKRNSSGDRPEPA